jgi:hypothetical protein
MFVFTIVAALLLWGVYMFSQQDLQQMKFDFTAVVGAGAGTFAAVGGASVGSSSGAAEPALTPAGAGASVSVVSTQPPIDPPPLFPDPAEKLVAREFNGAGSGQKRAHRGGHFDEYAPLPIKPVLGRLPTHGAVPLFGKKHQGRDAVFALACNYRRLNFQYFVGSLRKVGHWGDIVLAVSPLEKLDEKMQAYLRATNVVAYAFDVDCKGEDNCKLKDDFLGYPDPRPYRTFANIRYAVYEYWMQHYNDQSYILILDFRDTFFQVNPFRPFPYPVHERKPRYELHMFAENYKVKNIGNCVYNSAWVGDCFGAPALEEVKHLPVICSGSTLGSYPAIRHYISTMLKGMDEIQCWRKNIESDQGYQSYYFHTGRFNTVDGNATMFHQGTGVVNTIGALNGHRLESHQKGPLDTFWKIRDKDGFILNNDGTRSACVHQWDRFEDELVDFVESGKIFDRVE